MLSEKSEYLSSGLHIGMKSCTKYMRRFVYKIRDDGLAVFNLKEVDNRIAIAANFISGFDNILLVSGKPSSHTAVRKFAELTGVSCITGRFSPGTMTNPSYRDFCEPKLLVIVDPLVDTQAIVEAKKTRIPVVAMCDTFNDPQDIDLAIPVNNNGKKSIGLVFLLLAREIMKKKGLIKKSSDFKFKLKDFGGEDKKPEKPKQEVE